MSSQQFDAIYENGVFKPLTPLSLPENQRVTLVVHCEDGEPSTAIDSWLIVQDGDPTITLEEVHKALSSIPGSLSDEVIRQRDERF